RAYPCSAIVEGVAAPLGADAASVVVAGRLVGGVVGGGDDCSVTVRSTVVPFSVTVTRRTVPADGSRPLCTSRIAATPPAAAAAIPNSTRSERPSTHRMQHQHSP